VIDDVRNTVQRSTHCELSLYHLSIPMPVFIRIVDEVLCRNANDKIVFK
jgi:hypothetical protein